MGPLDHNPLDFAYYYSAKGLGVHHDGGPSVKSLAFASDGKVKWKFPGFTIEAIPVDPYGGSPYPFHKVSSPQYALDVEEGSPTPIYLNSHEKVKYFSDSLIDSEISALTLAMFGNDGPVEHEKMKQFIKSDAFRQATGGIVSRAIVWFASLFNLKLPPGMLQQPKPDEPKRYPGIPSHLNVSGMLSYADGALKDLMPHSLIGTAEVVAFNPDAIKVRQGKQERWVAVPHYLEHAVHKALNLN
jgi:hypothetical protein